MTLLRDFFSFGELQILTEAKGSSPMRVRGLFQEAEKPNGNRRVYARNLMEREVGRLQDVITERRLVGELDHPQSEVVSLSNASHLITGLEMDGNRVIGEAEVLNTPAGKVLQELMRAGVKVGISSRGTGSLTAVHEGGDQHFVVGENLKMITWDMVSDPSCQGAFPGLQESTSINEARDNIVNELDTHTAERVFLTSLGRALRKN